MKFLLLVIYIGIALGKSGGGSGGGRSSSSSSGSRSSSSSSRTSSGSSFGSSGSRAASNRIGPSINNVGYGYNTIYNYPTYYGYSNAYLYYLLYRRNSYYSSPYSTSSKTGCLAFTTNSQSSQQVVSSGASTNTSTNTYYQSPYPYSFYANFIGNTSLSIATARLLFSATGTTFAGNVSATASQINATLTPNSTDATVRTSAVTLIRQLLDGNSVGAVLSSMDIGGMSGSVNGNYFDLDAASSVLSGVFTISGTSFTFNGSISSITGPVATLDISTSSVETIALTTNSTGTQQLLLGFNTLSFSIKNWNATIDGDSIFTAATLSNYGNIVRMDECDGDGLSTGQVVGIVIGSIVGVFILCCVGIALCRRRGLGYSNGFPSIVQSIKPAHNVHDAGKESLMKSNRFLQEFPPGSPQAEHAAAFTANIPMSAAYSRTALTMMEPRLFADYPFNFPAPQVFISTMDLYTGRQLITFNTQQDVSIQSNIALRVESLYNATPEMALIPPPAYNAQYPSQGCYYEVQILRIQPEKTLAVGWATCPYPPFRLPGWDFNSVAYHSDDGAKFLNDVDYGHAFGPALHPGDTLGAGYTVREMNGAWIFDFYFVVNGRRFEAFSNVANLFSPMHIYPTIGADGECEIQVSFGDLS